MPDAERESSANQAVFATSNRRGKLAKNAVAVRDDMVLVHGLLRGPTTWDRIMPILDEKYRVVAVSLLQPTRRTKISSGTGADIDESAWEQVEALTAATSRVHLVGHSMGAVVAGRMLTARPEMVRSLTMIAPYGFSMLFGMTSEEMISTFARRAFPKPFRNATEGNVQVHLYEWALRNPLLHSSAVDEIQRTAHLTIWGSRDPVLPANGIEKSRVVFPRSTNVVIQGARHAPHRSHPHEVYEEIAKHCDRSNLRSKDMTS